MRLYAGIILSQPAASPLYFYARAKDTKGAGWLRLSIKHLCKFFNKSKDTILWWSRNCYYFWDAEVRGDRLFLKYKSISRVKANSKVPAHTSFESSIELLKDLKVLKAACYEAALARQQESCQYTIERLVGSSKKMFMPVSLESLQRSNYVSGCEHVERDTARAFVKKHVIPVGASQSTVAAKVGRSTSTLARHTKHLTRVQIWWRVNLRSNSQETPKYYYSVRVSKVRKDGTTREENHLYRRMPNYYFCNIHTRPELTAEVFTNPDPCTSLDDKQKLINYVVSQMPKSKPRGGQQGDLSKPEIQAKYLEKLSYLPKDRLDKLACGFLMYASGEPESYDKQQAILSQLSQVKFFDLIDKIGNTLSLLKADRDSRLMDYLCLLLKRAQKTCMVIPPMWESYRDTGYRMGC